MYDIFRVSKQSMMLDRREEEEMGNNCLMNRELQVSR